MKEMTKLNETEKRKYKGMGKNEELLISKEAARYLRVEKGTLAVWRSTKRYELPYIRMGRLIRYRVSDLEEFIEKYYEKRGEEEEVLGMGGILGRGDKK